MAASRDVQLEEDLVENLAVLMRGKLRANGRKPGWGQADKGDLLAILEQEMVELRSAIHCGKPAEVALECADVANMVAMIAWQMTRKAGD